ncbi:uncharacterized protein MYCFIDRAFT_200539 [Pseudocercospora fijiensis CIRAD86]|uniref:Uncharacterized protein n=1 Tax=Pseudocercospora fijiensis (strain CIRAD86) TaxID=383855 RepID=M2ZEF4_PSEFD|nr:uncharacterized protein MYCFIDRAFT_200539 [Pseudocercospora fijiensis CIRAD86]EME77514.1 hypothetical protein MYCFIDRAFT_200539 [Pseudocercospora fijiensis CIRAD86]
MASPSQTLIAALLDHLKSTFNWKSTSCTYVSGRLCAPHCQKKVAENTNAQMKYFLAQVVECYPHRMPDAVDSLVHLHEQTRCSSHTFGEEHKDFRLRACLSVFPIWIEIHGFLLRSDVEVREMCTALGHLGSPSYAEFDLALPDLDNEQEAGVGQAGNGQVIHHHSEATDSNRHDANPGVDFENNGKSNLMSTNDMPDGGEQPAAVPPSSVSPAWDPSFDELIVSVGPAWDLSFDELTGNVQTVSLALTQTHAQPDFPNLFGSQNDTIMGSNGMVDGSEDRAASNSTPGSDAHHSNPEASPTSVRTLDGRQHTYAGPPVCTSSVSSCSSSSTGFPSSSAGPEFRPTTPTHSSIPPTSPPSSSGSTIIVARPTKKRAFEDNDAEVSPSLASRRARKTARLWN